MCITIDGQSHGCAIFPGNMGVVELTFNTGLGTSVCRVDVAVLKFSESQLLQAFHYTSVLFNQM